MARGEEVGNWFDGSIECKLWPYRLSQAIRRTHSPNHVRLTPDILLTVRSKFLPRKRTVLVYYFWTRRRFCVVISGREEDSTLGDIEPIEDEDEAPHEAS